MKLLDIQLSASAWGVLSSLKKNPKLAYRLLKYEKKVEAELNVIEKQRNEYGCEAAGVASGAEWRLEPGTPEIASYNEKFNAFLQGDSDLQWIGISMDELIEALGAETGNVLSEQDIERLEPFFTEKPKAELTVVK